MTDHSDSEAIKATRARLGLSQAEFWNALGVSQPSGSLYESGTRMSEPLRRLYMLHYVAGIPTGATPEDLACLATAVKYRDNAQRARHLMEDLSTKLLQAAQSVGDA